MGTPKWKAVLFQQEMNIHRMKDDISYCQRHIEGKERQNDHMVSNLPETPISHIMEAIMEPCGTLFLAVEGSCSTIPLLPTNLKIAS